MRRRAWSAEAQQTKDVSPNHCLHLHKIHILWALSHKHTFGCKKTDVHVCLFAWSDTQWKFSLWYRDKAVYWWCLVTWRVLRVKVSAASLVDFGMQIRRASLANLGFSLSVFWSALSRRRDSVLFQYFRDQRVQFFVGHRIAGPSHVHAS